MYFLYSLLFTAAFLALLPYFVFQALKNGKYAGSFKQRLGRIPPQAASPQRASVQSPSPQSGSAETASAQLASAQSASPKTASSVPQIIWIHTVSVGEFLAAQPLIAALGARMPDYRIVVSTTTLAGQQLACKRMAAPENKPHSQDSKPDKGPATPEANPSVFYFPFDWSFAVRRALNQVNPALVVILETEFWPNFLRQCRRRGIPTVLVNGRISSRSYKRYSIARRFFGRVLRDVSFFLMQSQSDADRVLSLGASPDRVRVCGNLKYDVGVETFAPATAARGADKQGPTSIPASVTTPEPEPPFAECLGLSDNKHLIVAGSTAPGEEEMLLNSLRSIKAVSGLEDSRLILAPRNPERFDEVAQLLARSGVSFLRRSRTLKRELQTGTLKSELQAGTLKRELQTPDVLLLDTIGELASAYRFAAVVFVGGSLVPRGGHNIIEPAACSKPIIVGPHTENFRQVVADFREALAVVELSGPLQDALTTELTRMLSDPEYAASLGIRARELLVKNQGATACTLAAIRSVLQQCGHEHA